MVRCDRCGLVRSDPIAPDALLARVYSESMLEYHTEIPHLRATYGRLLRGLRRFGATRGSLLEIGCGNGFFLQEALEIGYDAVQGVEPSRAAVTGAPPELRDRIRLDVVRPGLLERNRFDVVCLFQVLDHLADPKGVLSEVHEALRPGGLLLTVQHNVEAFSARILGERSPIVDVEHTYLFSPKTAGLLCQSVGFDVLDVGSIWNRISIEHFLSLLPLTARFRFVSRSLLGKLHLGRMPLWLPLGNLRLIARKKKST
jgi:SAM-dependent methyltransferase